MKKLTLFCLFIYCTTTLGFPSVIQVPADYPTIQSAIIAAATGDTVLVAKGTYSELITFDGKNIVLASQFLTTGDSLCIDETILRPISQGSVVSFVGGESEQARLVGFTIKDGSGTKEGSSWLGGGIYVANSHPTLESLIVTGNTVGGLGSCGGGIYFRESHSLVKDCRIVGNEATYGAGIRCDGSDITVTTCWFQDNFAVASGGGIMFVQCISPLIVQSVFTGNNGIYGGAIACYESSLVIDRITSFLNHGGYGGTLHAESNSNIRVINSIFWDNSLNPTITNEIFLGAGANTLLVAYSDIMGSDTAIHIQGTGTVNWMEGNIELYPEFNNPVALDLTLSELSPCIDAGTPLYIHNGDTLVYITDYAGTAPEMGAYEFPVPVSSDHFPGSETQFDLMIQTGIGSAERVVTFNLTEMMQVRLALFDIRGRMLGKMYNQKLPSGFHSIPIHTSTYPTGIYVLRFMAGDYSQSQKLLIN